MFISGEDYLALAQIAPPQWILEDLLPVGGMMNLYGSPKSGKSWLALKIAEAVSTNRPDVLGIPVRTHGPVCYLQVDTPRGEWTRRSKLVVSEGLNLNHVYFADKESGTPFPFNIITDWSILKKYLDIIQPVLFIMDTLRESFRGDENDSGIMQNVITHFVKALPPACAAMFLSHSRKETLGAVNDVLSSMRGSSYIAGRMDVIMQLTKKELTYVSRSIEETTLDVFQYSRSSGKSGLVHLNEDEGAIMTALDRIVRDTDAKGLQNESELARRLHSALNGQLNGKKVSIDSDAYRKQVNRRMERVLFRINASTQEKLA